MTKPTDPPASRRAVLQAGLQAGLATAAGAAALSRRAQAQPKIEQKLVQYIPQSKKPTQHCSNCVNFVAPHSCKIVEGEIAPNGWCVSWSPAPKSAS